MTKQNDNGFVVHYASDIDGDRYAIIESEDADMSGWRIEVAPDEAWYANAFGGDGAVPSVLKPRIEEFTRDYFLVPDGPQLERSRFRRSGSPMVGDGEPQRAHRPLDTARWRG
ncbi:hypothetical protein A5724_04915 [Mycobacterium sp. ACS1612]|uniref:hypothetical protein n=1 Tax=Mycobacterium sp. ACS1612 TaxID=1834117 RepID=UPI0007FEB0A2|nr:hypothetical protein [Mycobacterium sp. ACS1612]OBF41676.1 hypothetical protein A5724_04915 [Mycobacterium sp. ACS1612]